jgi:hypothetical protein
MRRLAVAVFLLGIPCAAKAQCAIGEFATTEGGMIVCQSAAGPRPPGSGYAPGGVVNCPIGTTPMVEANGRRTCVNLAQRPLEQDMKRLPAKRKQNKFEISKKCPACK